MEEKKQTKKLSYSPIGKGFRGLLCMVTFAVFSVSASLTIYAVNNFGWEILTEKENNYYDTSLYQDNLSYEVMNILSDCSIIEMEKLSKDQISLMDVSGQMVGYYDKMSMGDDLYYEEFTITQPEDMVDYKVDSKKINVDMNDYQQAREYISSDEVSDYIYFNEKAFRNLFINTGLKNTGYRFSEDFSEDAYFVFENYSINEEEKETSEAETEYEFSIEASDDGIVIEKEIYDENGNVMSTEAYVEESVDTSLMEYAVYDPGEEDEEIYYSTWDDYFAPMGSYIYTSSELKEVLETRDSSGSRYNSLVIPLLRSYNRSLSELGCDIYNNYEETERAGAALSDYYDRGIYFQIESGNEMQYGNVDSATDITKSGLYYCFQQDKKGTITVTAGPDLAVPDMQWVDNLGEYFEGFTEEVTFLFGFDASAENVLNRTISPLVQDATDYNWFGSNSLWIAILAVVSFVLLVILAVGLICTTGRKYKGDTEVELNFYDKSFTEIWAVIYIGVMIASITCGALVCDTFIWGISIYQFCGVIVAGALPFGFCLMVFTLSFARRIKAHNIWNHFLIAKLVRKIQGKEVKTSKEGEEKKRPNAVIRFFQNAWNRCKQAYYNLNGTKKLLIGFAFFIIVNIVVVFVAIENPAFNGESLFLFLLLQAIALLVVIWLVKDIEKLTQGVNKITKGDLDSKVEIDEKISVFGELADGINHIGDGLKSAVETSLKDERMKTELITNVSHDLKTPLTSIINYIDLLKKQEMPNDDAKHYIEVLDGKAQRLKQLTEDLVEAAKATSGNIELEMMPLTFDELMKQALGEFEDKYEAKKLTIIASYPKEPAVVMADGRRLFRIIENVLQNIYKYAMEGTRVYADLAKDEGVVTFTLKNVSAAPLNISADELMERFTRGDSSRTTEGSGLGLSIAKDLTRLQNGEFEIQLDGDLFKVIIRFPECK